MSKYISLEQRAEQLIAKGREVWQEIQRIAMAEDELVDSVVLLGQDLWLPHHETDGSQFRATLQIAVHYPPHNVEEAQRLLAEHFRQLEERSANDEGWVRIQVEAR